MIILGYDKFSLKSSNQRSVILSPVNKPRNKITKAKGSPWSSIPNVKEFKIIPGSLDGLGFALGLHKKTKPTIEFIKGRANKANRYVRYIENYMLKHRTPDKYGLLTGTILENSKVFRILAINHVYYGWYKKDRLKVILTLNKRVSSIFRNKETNLNISRVYIPKKDPNKWRPLGVPAPEGRVASHELLNFLYGYLSPNLSPHQHAYKPGFSIYTAGKDLGNILNEPNIFEFDLEGFFDSVNIKHLKNVLYQMGVPEVISRYIYFIFVNHRMKIPQNPQDSHDAAKLQSKESYKRLYELEHLPTYGVPQGLPLSPLLATLVLEKTLLKSGAIMYADDGLISVANPGTEVVRINGIKKTVKSPFDGGEKILMEAAGIKLNGNKSRGVKLEGKGLSSFKFLGIIYDPILQTLTVESRKGVKRQYEGRGELLTHLMKQRGYEEGDLQLSEMKIEEARLESFFLPGPKQRLEEFIKSQYTSSVGARLGLEKPNQIIKGTQQLTGVKKSGMDVRSRFDTLDFFNASSKASQGMLENLKMN